MRQRSNVSPASAAHALSVKKDLEKLHEANEMLKTHSRIQRHHVRPNEVKLNSIERKKWQTKLFPFGDEMNKQLPKKKQNGNQF